VPSLEDLQRAQEEVIARVRAIRPEQWVLASPCDRWSLRDLVIHLVEGSKMSVLLVGGASAQQSRAAFGTDHGDDLAGELESNFATEMEAFHRDGAMESVIHHPVAGDIPATVFLGFRTSDYLLHSWDIARATGADEELPEDLVTMTWETMEPLAPVISTIGVFGKGPSGNVPEDAPLQLRLLDLSGRRP
jgi:uncharacterized protein (TIGR03086 family)